MAQNTFAGPAPIRRSVPAAPGGPHEDHHDWLRRLDDPAVVAHLHAEREHHDLATAHLAGSRERLAAEVLARTPAEDTSVPWTRAGATWFTRHPADARHPQLLQVGPGGGGEQIVLDLDLLAEGSPYVALGCVEPSPDGRLVAYSVDRTGDELHELRFRDVDTGRDLPDRLFPVGRGGGWGADGSTFFYTVPDETYRPYQAVRHRLGRPLADDELVHEEEDRRFEVSVRTTPDGGWVVVTSASRDTSEVRLVNARRPGEQARLVAARRPGVQYDVEVLPGGWAGDGPDRLLLVTDDRAPEFRLVEAPLPLAWSGPGDPATWGGVERALTAPDERLESVVVLARHLVLALRRDCEPFLRVVDRVPAPDTRGVREVHPGVPCGRLALWHAEDPDTEHVVVVEENLVTAPVWVEVELATGARRVLKRTSLPGVDPTRYQTERLAAESADGTPVPVTIARLRTLLPGTAEGCLLQVHGAHERASWPAFDVATLSLLDRGVVVAVAHVRGGGELGRRWWDGGRLRHKERTFEDHLASADALERAGWAGPGAFVGRGRGAGGLVQAVVHARAPHRWRGIVAETPVVDVVGRLCDPLYPRSGIDTGEWGDPADPGDGAAFAAVLRYSPYDHPPAGPAAPLLVTAALYDRRVLVHEPAKWVARLREAAPAGPSSRLLLRVELGACGHEGPSGRPERVGYEAEILAWVLERLGLAA